MFACIQQWDTTAEASKQLQDCAGSFSPAVELTTPGTAVFDVSSLGRLYASLSEIGESIARHARSSGLNVNVAIAPNAEAAILAARNISGITVIPEEAAATFAQLDIDNLPLTDAMWETLESWGIRTFHDLAQLPEIGLAERLGPEAVRLRQLARGAVDRPLKIEKPEVRFEERVELEHPLTLLEPLLFVLSRILNDQCAKLQSHGLATNQVRLVLELEGAPAGYDRELRLPVPMRQSQPLLKLLQLNLEAHPPEAPIQAVILTLQPVPPRRIQNGLFLPATPAPDKLELTLARIRGWVGEDNVGIPELLDTHHPEPFRLAKSFPYPAPSTRAEAPRLAFRYFRPPLPVRVELAQNRPLRLAAAGIRGNVITCAGPWRTSGDWWTDRSWNRDEWDVSLNDGALYRIYRQPTAAWFVEGAYD